LSQSKQKEVQCGSASHGPAPWPGTGAGGGALQGYQRCLPYLSSSDYVPLRHPLRFPTVTLGWGCAFLPWDTWTLQVA